MTQLSLASKVQGPGPRGVPHGGLELVGAIGTPHRSIRVHPLLGKRYVRPRRVTLAWVHITNLALFSGLSIHPSLGDLSKLSGISSHIVKNQACQVCSSRSIFTLSSANSSHL